MEALDYLLTLIYAQPALSATLCVIAVGIITLALTAELRAHRTYLPVVQRQDPKACVFMKLQAIHLLPENRAVDLQLIAYINGMEFHYPSSDKTKWLSSAQATSEIIVELPDAEFYRIHLALHLRSGETLEGGPSVVRRALLQLPPSTTGAMPVSRVSEEYKLYLLEDGLRDTNIKALIPYECYLQSL